MLACGVAVLLGLAAVVRWGGLEITPPPPEVSIGKRYAWSVAVAVVGGLGGGVLVAGAGGRLAMRLLAATAGDAAQGRLTEAEETVGRITTGGTIGFILFVGVFSGLAAGGLLMILRRWLPNGRWRGVAFGGLLLVGGATRVEPLRGDNPDFDVVGPSWVALVAFMSLVLLTGMAVAAIAARYAQHQPVFTGARRDVLRHAPALLLAPLAAGGVLVLLAGLGLVALSATRVPDALRSQRAIVVGRVVLAVAVFVALPGFVSTVAGIAGRGP